MSLEISVVFKPLWIALSVSFVGVAGMYARTTANIHRMKNRITGGNVEAMVMDV